MTISDAELGAAFRAGYDELVESAPPPCDWYDLAVTTPRLATTYRRRQWQMVGAALGAFVLLIVAIGSIALLAGDAQTTNEPQLTLGEAGFETYSVGDSVLITSDCPAADPHLAGPPDTLPAQGATDRARVLQLLTSDGVDLLSRYGAADARFVQRNGQVVSGNGSVIAVDDYQIELTLDADAPCPQGPVFWNGIPVLFTRTETQLTSLDDGVVTFEEYATGLVHALWCIEAAGFSVQGPVEDIPQTQKGVTLSFEVSDVPSGQSDSAAATGDCLSEHFNGLNDAWNDSIELTDDELTQRELDRRACARAKGFDAPAEMPSPDFYDLVNNNFTDLEGCLAYGPTNANDG